jgi:multidrug efflux system outer membrane protein
VNPRFAALGLAALLAGCAGMPPKPKPVVLPNEAPLAGLALQGGGSWPAQDWWQRYQDPTLDALIALGLGSSPTLATAHARFDTARQSVRVAGAAAGVQVTAVGDIERQRLSDNGLFPPQLLGFTWYNQADLGLQFSYTFDWWGKQRDLIQAAMDEAHAAQADHSAAALLLTSSIADTYFGWQADQARLALARGREATVQREGAIAVQRVRADLDSEDSLRNADVAVAAAREQIANLEGSAKLRVVALAALVGRSVADLPPLTPKPLPVTPDAIPDGVSLDLIARRADIAASRWRVEAAEKNLASARAEFYPDISINALAGLSSIDIGKLLEYGSRVPQAEAAIHLPLFDSGRIKAHYGAVQASINSAVETYRETLVSAAREVATQATTRAQLAAQRAQRAIESDAARQLEASAAARVRQGVVDPRSELTAAEASIQQHDALLQLDAAALSADIALQRALGGGYVESTKAP